MCFNKLIIFHQDFCEKVKRKNALLLQRDGTHKIRKSEYRKSFHCLSNNITSVTMARAKISPAMRYAIITFLSTAKCGAAHNNIRPRPDKQQSIKQGWAELARFYASVIPISVARQVAWSRAV